MAAADDNLAQIRASVRALCARFQGEYWRKLDRERDYPTEFVAALTEAGYLAALIPEQYGGSGLTLAEATAIMEEIHASGCNGAACHAQMYTMGTLLRHGSDVQKERWLSAIASGELRLQAFGVTEPTSGSDTLGLRTTAVRDGDHYIINGQKVWTSRAEHSDLMLLLARTTPREQAKTRTGGLSVFLVDMRLAQGASIRINEIRTMMNHATTEIFFDDLRVPEENLIGEEGEGFRYILSGMNAERILIAAECIGDAKWFIAKATAYAKEREVFGRPIGQNQGVQFPIARAYAQMRAAELMVRDAAERFQAGRDCGAEANMAKLLAADASWAAAEMCVQTHGGFGFAEPKSDLSRRYVAGTMRLQASKPQLAQVAADKLAALQQRHESLRALLKTNLTVLATAHAVSEGIVRGVSNEIARRSAPQTYGASGRANAPSRAAATPIAVSRSL